MGAEYELFNATKRERIDFAHLRGSKARELAGNPETAAIVTWYLARNSGDRIALLPVGGDPTPVRQFTEVDDSDHWPEVMESVIAELIAAEILRNEGKSWEDEDEPETIYVRHLTNVWGED